jgi:hypothetical protein
VPGGGLSPDHSHWISSRPHFFLPVKVLSHVFRGKFLAGLRCAFHRHQLRFYGGCLPLTEEKNFEAFLRTLFQQDWVVYAKPRFGGPEHVLHYLARYTHRVAISNHRLLSVSDSGVTFRWKDYAHGSKQRTMTLSPEEFLRRFLQHVLPRGFPRIRYFGWLTNRSRGSLLPLCRCLLGQPPESYRHSPGTERRTSISASAIWHKPRKGTITSGLPPIQELFALRKRDGLDHLRCDVKADCLNYFEGSKCGPGLCQAVSMSSRSIFTRALVFAVSQTAAACSTRALRSSALGSFGASRPVVESRRMRTAGLSAAA